MLFYFDKRKKLQNVNFSEWIDLMEHSFSDADIPEWFYVCPFFSHELTIGPQPGVTPKGAVASLVGLPGISETTGILSFYTSNGNNQVALQMPGKAVVALNKLSKTNYDNEDYLSSYGFRTGRRLVAGTDARSSQHSIYERVLEYVVGKLRSAIGTPGATYDGFQTKDGKEIKKSDLIDMLRKELPRRIDAHNRFAPRHVKKPASRFQGDRKKHLDNHLKDVFNAPDFAARLKYLLRDVPGVQKLDKPASSGKARPKNKIDEAVIRYINNAGGDAFFSDIVEALVKAFPKVYNKTSARKYIVGMSKRGKLAKVDGAERYFILRKQDNNIIHDFFPSREEANQWFVANIKQEWRRMFEIMPDVKLRVEREEADPVNDRVYDAIDKAGGEAYLSDIAPGVLEDDVKKQHNRKTIIAHMMKLVQNNNLEEVGQRWHVIRVQDNAVIKTFPDEAEANQWLTDNKASLDSKKKKPGSNDYMVMPDLKVRVRDKSAEPRMTALEDAVRYAVETVFKGFEHEGEWVMKVQPIRTEDSPGIKGKIPEDEAEAKQYNADKVGKAKYKPVLHVPAGSILYLGTPSPYEFDKPWKWFIKKEWDEFEKGALNGTTTGRAEDFYEHVVKKYRMWRWFEIHINKNESEVRQTATTKARSDSMPLDGDRKDIWKVFAGMVEKGQQGQGSLKLDFILKKMEKVANMPQARMKLYIERWMHQGLVKIDNAGNVKLENPDFDEIHHLLLGSLKTQEGTDRDLASRTKMPLDEVRVALKELEAKEKVYLAPSGKWDIKLTDAEMNSLNEPEKKAIELLEQGNDYYDDSDFTYALTQENVAEADAKFAIRTLRMKGKIYKGKWSGYYRLYIDSNKPMNEDEKKIIEYLREWPVSDTHSLISDLGLGHDQMFKALSGLESRKMVYGDDTDNDVRLNTKVVTPMPTAKTMTPIHHKILEILRDHFTTDYREIAALTKTGMDSYDLNNHLGNLISKGLVEKDPTSGRYMAKDGTNNLTEEEKWLLANLKEAKTKYDLTHEMRSDLGIQYRDSTINGLLKHMKSTGQIKESYDPVNDDAVYHANDYDYKPEVGHLTQSIRKLLEKRARTKDDLSSKLNINWNISDNGMDYVLDLMQKHGEIESKEDFSGKEVFYLKDYEVKGPEHYREIVLKLLQEEGPKTRNDIYNEISESSGIHKQALNWLLRWMQGEEGGQREIEQVAHPLTGNNVFATLNYDWSKIEEKPLQKMMQMLQDGPKTYYDFENKYATIGAGYGAIQKLLDKLVADTSKGVKVTTVMNSKIYHLEGQDPQERWDKLVFKVIKDFGGEATLAEIGYQLYNQHGAPSSTQAQQFVREMEKQGKIKRVSGDENAGSSLIIYSTEEIQKDMGQKIAELENKYIDFIDEYIEEQGGETSLYYLWDNLRYRYSSDFPSAAFTKRFIFHLEKKGLLQRSQGAPNETDEYSIYYKVVDTPEKSAKKDAKWGTLAQDYWDWIEKYIQNHSNEVSLWLLGEDLYYSEKNSNSGYSHFSTTDKARKLVDWLVDKGRLIKKVDPNDSYNVMVSLAPAATSAQPTTAAPAPNTGIPPGGVAVEPEPPPPLFGPGGLANDEEEKKKGNDVVAGPTVAPPGTPLTPW